MIKLSSVTLRQKGEPLPDFNCSESNFVRFTEKLTELVFFEVANNFEPVL